MSVGVCRPLLTIAVLALALSNSAHAAISFDFEDPDSPLNEVWAPCELDGPSQTVEMSNEKPCSGERSVKLTGKLPEGFGVTYKPWRDWTGHTTLSMDVWLPENVAAAGDDFMCLVYLKDRNFYWYQAPLLHDPRTFKRLPLKAGGWNHYELDISPTSKVWQAGGHGRAWGYALHRPREFGIRFSGKRDWEGAVYIDNVKLEGSEMPLGKRAGGGPAAPAAPRMIRPVLSAESVPLYEKLEITFELDTFYDNPFDPEVVDVQGHFVSPSGQQIDVPGFFYESYERSQNDQGFERMNPVGKPCWKVRFAAKEEGEWKYSVTVDDAAGSLRSTVGRFTATAPVHPEGYVRVSQKDPLYFEFENGDWFYPVGINMRDGGDDATDQKGTYDFDYYFKRFHDEGINFVRTWMCAWWGGIEWSDEYHSRFDDIGRYNTYNAWRLDHCVDLAEQYGIFLEVTLNSHGQVRRDKFDEEWTYSPWNPRNGGHVASPAMFFTSERVKKEFLNRYRYIIARWGYSRNVMSWDLWNEVDLAEGYYPDVVSGWHKQMAGALKQMDPWKHLVVTHICLFWGFGNEMWALPEIEYVQSDAYWDQNDKRTGDFRTDMGMRASYQGKVRADAGNAPLFQKPFVFIEYGPLYIAVSGGKVSPEEFAQRFRIGMWTSAVIPNAGPGLYWYHQEWDKHQLYQYQKPLMKLFSGYDRRGRDLRLKNTVVVKGGAIRSIGMSDGTEGFFYVHNPEVMQQKREAITPIAEAKLYVYDTPTGMYDVEFIDTLTAETTGTVEVEVPEKRTRLMVDLPPVADDLLVRVKRRAQ